MVKAEWSQSFDEPQVLDYARSMYARQSEYTDDLLLGLESYKSRFTNANKKAQKAQEGPAQ